MNNFEANPSPGEPRKIPMKPVDLSAAISDLTAITDHSFDGLNKPILTIAPSAIAATIAFVGATSNNLIFSAIQSSFLVGGWLFWLLSIVTILFAYMLRGYAVTKPLYWAKQFDQMDFSAVKLDDLEHSVLRNRNLFDPNKTMMNCTKWLQIASPIFFTLGFMSTFIFLALTFLFKS